MAKTVSTTTLNFGLVSTEVKLKKVEEVKSVSFKTASPDGNEVKQVYRDLETGAIFDKADCTKGIFDAAGFHEVGPEALKAIDEECKLDAMDLTGFMPLADAPTERARACYYLAPGGNGGVKPLALLRDGLAKYGLAGYGRLTLTTKTYPFVVYEKDGGLFVLTLAYADEFTQAREASETLAGVETDEGTLALAGTLFSQIGGSREALDAITDDRRAKREELVALALAGEAIPVTAKAEKPEAPTQDLAAQLAASIGAAAAPAEPKKPRRKKAEVAA